MSDKHTPGPWVVNRDRYSYITNPLFGGIVADICYVAGEEPLFVCTPTDHIVIPDERIHNARLIAAAPELLDALKALSNPWHECETATECARRIARGDSVSCALIVRGRQAIRQAEGREVPADVRRAGR